MNINEFLNNEKNRPFVLASMCADPLHHAHINIINEAKKYGNVIIGLMTDEAMINYKREPLIKFENRYKVVKELRSVSIIIPLENLNFSEIVNKYKIEFFVHGDDWKDGVQSEHRKKLIKTMKSWGGKVIDVAYTEGISSSNLISKM